MNLADMSCKQCTVADKLNSEEAGKLLEKLSGWEIGPGGIEKVFKFDDFNGSVEFVNKIAPLAEEQNHHPDININWNKVKLSFMTHSIKGLSMNDFIMAAKVDKII